MNRKPENYIVWYWQKAFGHSSATIEANDALEAAQILKKSIAEKYGHEHIHAFFHITRVNPEKY